MAILETIRIKASQRPRTIILPESDDNRTIDAVNIILDKRIAKITLIGREEIKKRIISRNANEVTLIDPATYAETDKMVAQYYEMRKSKGMTEDEARQVVTGDYVTFGALLVRNGLADGFVAGANHTTPDVIRAALRCLSIDRSVGTVSGAFLMEVPNSPFGEKGVFIFADCGVNPDPNANQLAGIAISSARLFKKLTGAEPRVALLSYSSKGSSGGEMVKKVVEAVKKAQESAPELIIDGEFQVDSALVQEVARTKCAESPVAGRANVLIFPDLNSGNISYKIVQRLANARAVGPILQGFTKSCSDLSRGCIVDDIVDAAAITSLMAS